MQIREAFSRMRFLEYGPDEQYQLIVKIYGTKAEIKDALSALAQICAEPKPKKES
jgi:hypothetical protein